MAYDADKSRRDRLSGKQHTFDWKGNSKALAEMQAAITRKAVEVQQRIIRDIFNMPEIPAAGQPRLTQEAIVKAYLEGAGFTPTKDERFWQKVQTEADESFLLLWDMDAMSGVKAPLPEWYNASD